MQAYRVMFTPKARAMHTNLTFSLRYANPENLSLQLKVPLVEQEFRPVNAKWSLDLGSVADPIPFSFCGFRVLMGVGFSATVPLLSSFECS